MLLLLRAQGIPSVLVDPTLPLLEGGMACPFLSDILRRVPPLSDRALRAVRESLPVLLSSSLLLSVSIFCVAPSLSCLSRQLTNRPEDGVWLSSCLSRGVCLCLPSAASCRSLNNYKI